MALIHSTFTGTKFGFNPAADPGILRLGSKSETSYKTKYQVGSCFGGRKTRFKAHNFGLILTESRDEQGSDPMYWPL